MINDLDKLIIDTVKIISKYTTYVTVGEYVSILFGRSRMSEDIDLLIPKISKQQFREIFLEIEKNGFWCLNSKSLDDNYELLADGYAIRVTRNEWVIPNVEIRFISDESDQLAYNTRMVVRLPSSELNVSRPEIQIPYKRYVLGSPKDIEDAIHLEEIFKDQIDKSLLKKIQERIDLEYRQK